MTKSTITRERLAKIKSWRETYGAGSNVMLPAEEAEELACLALAAMDSEPVAWTWQHLKQWHVTNDEERARDLAWDGVKVEPLYRHAQPAPDGYVMVPMRLTAENGAKGALSGEFSETKFVNCPECFGDDECETCDGSGRIEITVPVTWTTIKAIWVKGVEHFAATAQENN
ncbi:hypothetical protein C4Y57_014625 [Klebsiella variicola]|uniref:hypothetical protein n=1 Tax=Klebsiella variicola TaxID=244366 RepID=UPI000CEBC4C7|nr:hypothetical protein [Klebsiella variicola]ELN4044044.1 hypothetical protein [Klebsiella variicola]ROG41471.1 hypothetical protein C4Y57_014625 [Klebsiella variicola]HBR2052334.1 hypothetical protein [Klebsiella pneumoniae]